MKKLFKTRFFLPIMLIAVYIIGLALGTYALTAVPVKKQSGYFCKHARRIAQEYIESSRSDMEGLTGANIRIIITDASGNWLCHVRPTNLQPEENPVVSVEKYLPSVLRGKEIFRIAIADETQRELSDFLIVAGAPVVKDGAVVGAAFVIKNMMDLPEAVIGYICYFTVLYWLSAYFIVSNIRKGKKLEKLRRNYVDNITHALKTPVASIKALSETLCDGVEPDPDRQRRYCGMILREANRQDHMIRDALELSKMQGEGSDFSKRCTEAKDVFGPALEKYEDLFDYTGISVHVSDTIKNLPDLHTNAECLKQLLGVLLDNTLKFVREGGDIWLEATIARKVATICVRDNGIGIEKQAQPFIFDRFYKISHDFNENGSGLGLAIAKEISIGLKEKIWVESEPGKGAAFYFTVHLH